MTEPKRTRAGRGRPGRAAVPGRRPAPTQARLLAFRVLSRVESAGAYADLTLHAALRACSLGPRDRALVTDLVYGTLRQRGRLDFLLGFVLDREFSKVEPRVATLLRLGAYQIAFCQRIPDSAAVDQAVRCAHSIGAGRATGLINAVLRRLSSRITLIPLPALADDPLGHLTHTLSLPSWLARRFLDRFGAEEAARLGEALLQIPPLTVRANPLRGSRAQLLEELRERHPQAEPTRISPLGIRLEHAGDPGREPALREGRLTVQDEGSQLVVELLEPGPGERILDVCAAPGTKTTAIAERIGPEGSVVALDRNPRRLRIVGRDARRLGLANVTLAATDATQPLDAEAPPQSFDRVLVDAPCSGAGVLRRNPDARWRIGPEDPARLAEVQQAILRQAVRCLRPGGVLVYSTCTLLPEENEAVVEAFLAENAGMRRTPATELPDSVRALIGADGSMRTLPHLHDTDGFFAARMERTR